MALNIRKAVDADRDNLLVLIALMHAESPRFNVHAFSLDKALKLTEHMIAHCGVFVAMDNEEMVGFFAGVINEHFLSFDKFAADIGVYVRPWQRGSSAFVRLVRAFESWAKEQGATELCLGVSTEVSTESTVRMYERLGYKMSSYGLIKAGV